jgi:hypothetical protein
VQKKESTSDSKMHLRGDAAGGLPWYGACGIWLGGVEESKRPVTLNRAKITCDRCKKVEVAPLPEKRWKVTGKQVVTRMTFVFARTPWEARERATKASPLDWTIDSVDASSLHNAHALSAEAMEKKPRARRTRRVP